MQPILTALWLEATERDFSGLPKEALDSLCVNRLDFPIKEVRRFVFVHEHDFKNYVNRIDLKCLGMVSISEVESIKIIPTLRVAEKVQVRLKEGIYEFKLSSNGNAVVID